MEFRALLDQVHVRENAARVRQRTIRSRAREIQGRENKLEERTEGYISRARAYNVLVHEHRNMRVREVLVLEKASLRNERVAVQHEKRAIAAEQECIGFEFDSVNAEKAKFRAIIQELRHGVNMMVESGPGRREFFRQ